MSHHEAVSPFFRLRTAMDSLFAPSTIESSTTAYGFRSAAIGLLVALAYYAGSQVGFLLTPGGAQIAAFWPPNAILLAALLLTSRRIWWVLILAVFPAHLLIQLGMGVPLASALWWFVGNVGEALLGAIGVRFFKKDEPLFESVHGLIVFLTFGVLLPTLATSFLDAAGVILTGLGQNYLVLWTARLTSNLVADLTIVPTIAIFGVKGIAWFRRASSREYCEAAAFALSAVVVSLLVFDRESAISSFWPFIYALLPLLIWALLRFGPGGVSASLLAVALISLSNTIHGRGPFGLQSMDFAVLSLKFLLTVLAVSFLLSSAVIAERRRDQYSLRAEYGNLVYARKLEYHRIARELHDNILQRLTLVGLQLDELRAASLVFTKTPFNNLYDQISDISNRIRDLSHELHPYMLEYLGLPRALRKLCRDSSARFGITIEFSEYGATALLPSEISTCLFRVAQEALQNIVQYSHAKTAAVVLKVVNKTVVLRVSDDGVLFDAACPPGVGLTFMREQVLAQGGKLEITSVPSKGTVIEASFAAENIS
jgi:signal transduction histidine kinase